MSDKKNKVGLVLEGGAMRGMYTAGVLDVLLEEGIAVDEIVGVSAGALFGVNFLSEQKGRVIRYNKRFNRNKDYMGIRPLLKEGNIVSTDLAYREVPEKLDPFDNDTFMRSHIPFYAVVTRVRDGIPEYIRVEDVFRQMDVLRASGSMPFVSQPVRIGTEEYLDGGISDSIPVEWIAKQGCRKRVVILTRDLTYRKKPMNSMIIRMYARKYPKLAEQLKRRHLVYNRTVEKLIKWEQKGQVFIIRPSVPIEIGRLEKNPENLQAVYDLGIRDAKQQMSALRTYLASERIES